MQVATGKAGTCRAFLHFLPWNKAVSPPMLHTLSQRCGTKLKLTVSKFPAPPYPSPPHTPTPLYFVAELWHLAVYICCVKLIPLIVKVIAFSCRRRFRMQFYTVSDFKKRLVPHWGGGGWSFLHSLDFEKVLEVFHFKQLAQILMNMHNKYHTLTFIVVSESGNCLFPLCSLSVANIWRQWWWMQVIKLPSFLSYSSKPHCPHDQMSKCLRLGIHERCSQGANHRGVTLTILYFYLFFFLVA